MALSCICGNKECDGCGACFDEKENKKEITGWEGYFNDLYDE